MRVSICRGGCRPVWEGHLEECPRCGASVRTTLVEAVPGAEEGSA